MPAYITILILIFGYTLVYAGVKSCKLTALLQGRAECERPPEAAPPSSNGARPGRPRRGQGGGSQRIR